MKLAVLSSSRADFSIYKPLLTALRMSDAFSFELIVFGTHISDKHGFTLRDIQADGFEANHVLMDTFPISDKPSDISMCMAKTIEIFSDFWKNNKYDLVFALGDRFEMFSACLSGVPFNIKIAHIHGGETTLGAIDEIFRHSITHMSKLHFSATDVYKKKVIQLIGSANYVYDVGALSIDNLRTIHYLSKKDIYEKYGIDFNNPTILTTFHPETIDFEKNSMNIQQLLNVFQKLLDYQIVCTMPNSDTSGNVIRKALIDFQKSNLHPNFYLYESLGFVGYYSFMKNCTLMLGNTSSGFAEAYYFYKPVVNLGNRQSGRIVTENIFNSEINENEIMLNVVKALDFKIPKTTENLYGNGDAATRIIKILNEIRCEL